jgi:uncharacterized membrane protein
VNIILILVVLAVLLLLFGTGWAYEGIDLLYDLAGRVVDAADSA